MKLESENIEAYLAADKIVNWKEPSIYNTARELTAGIPDEIGRARRLYEWVRDEIPHSHDIGTNVLTCIAGDVLKRRTGICFSKSHLLAALLRAIKIPAGFCYQIVPFPLADNQLILHGLNGIYLSSIQKWIRVDARGNTHGIDARFSLDREQLAFPINKAAGQILYDTIYAAPLKRVAERLLKYKTRTELWTDLPKPF
ncbi:MAG: Transglutaminase-like superfamily protein [Syntrophus sp. PtaB.Bin001]|nr:MAG: Transglutaminase-like superfamily protein [Syntrophus sp. PtaB.Bin001]